MGNVWGWVGEGGKCVEGSEEGLKGSYLDFQGLEMGHLLLGGFFAGHLFLEGLAFSPGEL